jgi:hypothetical protein
MKTTMEDPAAGRFTAATSSKRHKRTLIQQDWQDPTQKIRCVFYNIDRTLPVHNPGTSLG